ncbi:beta-mannosidase, partial [Trichinella spiralis]
VHVYFANFFLLDALQSSQLTACTMFFCLSIYNSTWHF